MSHPSVGESEVVKIGMELRRLLILMERLDGWRFALLEHDYGASGLWSAKATWEGAKREHLRAYGASPDRAVSQLADKLADRYQVPV